jgi:hypothetical protein
MEEQPYRRPHRCPSRRALLGRGGTIFQSMLGIPGFAWAQMTDD